MSGSIRQSDFWWGSRLIESTLGGVLSIRVWEGGRTRDQSSESGRNYCKITEPQMDNMVSPGVEADLSRPFARMFNCQSSPIGEGLSS